MGVVCTGFIRGILGVSYVGGDWRWWSGGVGGVVVATVGCGKEGCAFGNGDDEDDGDGDDSDDSSDDGGGGDDNDSNGDGSDDCNDDGEGGGCSEYGCYTRGDVDWPCRR